MARPRRVPPGVRVLLVLLAIVLIIGVKSALDSHVDVAGTEGPGVASDGEHTGFVTSFSGGEIEFDPADVFRGAEAEAAAAADGELPPGGLPNPVYVRNPDEALVRLAVAPEFQAVLLSHADLQPRSVDAATLAGIYAGETDGSWGYASLTSWPVTLTVQGGMVVRAEEFYLP